MPKPRRPDPQSLSLWHQLQRDAQAQRRERVRVDRHAEVVHEQGMVLRLALAAMAADPASPLTDAQRQEMIALAHRTDPLTAPERAAYKQPLLAWAEKVMPRNLELIAQQFPQEEARDA
jgi:hypothetical protein